MSTSGLEEVNLYCQLPSYLLWPFFFQASPRLRFNKEGSLLAVTSADNGIKILANADGKHLLRAFENRAFENQRGPPEPAVSKVGDYNGSPASAEVRASSLYCSRNTCVVDSLLWCTWFGFWINPCEKSHFILAAFF